MAGKNLVTYFLIAISLVFCLIRCGGNKESSLNFNTNDTKVNKSGKFGITDLAVETSSNTQSTPAVAFDDANKRFLVVWSETKSSGKDILGKWFFLKTQTSGTQTFSFPVNITKVVAYDTNEKEVIPQAVSGLNSKTVTVTAPASTTLLFFSEVFTVYANVADTTTQQMPKIAIAYGYNTAGNQNFVVVWTDYKNDGASSTSPKIIGKVYDKNCSEIKKFYVAGTSSSFYTYSSTIYNLKNDITSRGQDEPSIAFDSYNKFIIAWVDTNDIEKNYRFAPRNPFISNLTNTTVTTETAIINNSSILDDKLVVYRLFDINGNPLPDPNDITSKRSIQLYSDLDVESSNISGDVTVNLNNVKTYKFEKSPKVAVDSNGNFVIAFIGKQFTSNIFYNYSSDAFPNTYINRGAFGSNVNISSSTYTDIFLRNIKSIKKSMEGKLFSTQFNNPDKSVASVDVGSFSISKSGDNNKFILTWTQNDGGVNKVKSAIFDAGTFTAGAAVDIATDKNSYNPFVTVTSNDEVFIVYERYDSDTAIRDIYGRYLLPTLDVDSDNFKITTGTGQKSYNPVMASDDSDRVFILFENDRNNSIPNIYGSLYTRKTPLTKPSVFLSYTSFDMGTTYIDNTVKKYLPVQNVGNGNLNITSASIPSPFQVISSVQLVPPNTTKYVGVKFSPTIEGSFSTFLTITTDDTANATLSVSVRGKAVAGVIIDTSNFKNKADLKSDYYAKLTATTPSQLQTNYEWSVVKGVLPDGISLDKNTGVLSGKATKTGVFEFEVKVKETNSGLTSAAVPLKIEVYDDIAYAEKGSFNCFIATAAYGSFLDPHVEILRSFRDKILLGTLTINISGKQFVIENYLGKVFVKTYYRYSPPIASFIAKSEPLKVFTRLILTPVVFFLEYFQQFLTLTFGVLLFCVLRKK